MLTGLGKRKLDEIIATSATKEESDDSEDSNSSEVKALSKRSLRSSSKSPISLHKSKETPLVKKTTRENESCRALVGAFFETFPDTSRIPTAVEILFTVRDIISDNEFEIYSSWLSPDHRATTVDNVISARAILSETGSSDVTLYRRVVDKRREHAAGRNHTAPAVFWMLSTSLLYEYEHQGDMAIHHDAYATFRGHLPRLVVAAEAYDRITGFHLILHRAYIFLRTLFQLIPVHGYLEVSLLIVSCLEGRAKHHQRSGGNRAFPSRAYRYLIERLGEKADRDASLAAEFDG